MITDFAIWWTTSTSWASTPNGHRRQPGFPLGGHGGADRRPGQLGYFTSGTTTIIRGSNDVDAASELEIQLTGIKALTVDDFYL